MLRKQDPLEFADYLEDSSGLAPGHAAEIVFPNSSDEAAAIIAECYAQKRPVTIAGAGTGIVGGRIPLGGVIAATDRLNRILDIRPLPHVIFGHIAENHLHLNLMPETAPALVAARALYKALLVKTVALGGTIVAEHGIGKLKQPYLV